MKKVFQTSSIQFFIFLLLAIFFLTGCSCNYNQILCPNTNSIVLYPKSQKCAKRFSEDAVNSYSTNFTATVTTISQVTAAVGANLKKEAQLLKDKLTSEDRLVQEMLQYSFLTLQQRPCDGDALYKEAMRQAADFKIRLATIQADLNKSKTETEVKQTLDEYSQGKLDGGKVGTVAGALDRYYIENNSYPSDLSKLTGPKTTDAVKSLGLSVIYTLESNDAFTLRFAGEDGKLNTADDMVHKGLKGKRND